MSWSLNKNKAKDLFLISYRIEREKKFKELDVDFMKAIENNDSGSQENITSLKNTLRDFPSTITTSSFETIEEFYNKQKKYASLSDKKKNLFKSFVSPFWVFVKIFILRLGFLEGWRGLIIAITYARYTYWKYKK